MKKLKVLTVIGTRPEIIKLSLVIKKLDALPDVEHVLVHTGQNFAPNMKDVFFEELGLRQPNYYLDVKADTLGGQIANVITRSEEVLKKEKPDVFLILGDTTAPCPQLWRLAWVFLFCIWKRGTVRSTAGCPKNKIAG